MIVEAQVLIDFVDWFEQVGLSVLPTPLGIAHVYPAPTGYDGLLIDAQDPSETQKTLSMGRDFIYGALNSFDSSELSSMGMENFFHQNVKWYGPGGIGACLSLEEFQERHQKPWLVAFPNRKYRIWNRSLPKVRFWQDLAWQGSKRFILVPLETRPQADNP